MRARGALDVPKGSRTRRDIGACICGGGPGTLLPAQPRRFGPPLPPSPPSALANVSLVAGVRIIEYTDPSCPWAFSAEPFKRRLEWVYGDQLAWEHRMVGLSDSPQHYEEIGFTPEKLSAGLRQIGHEHGMPMDTSLRPRVAATMPACKAVVATRLHAPEKENLLLRWLRVRHFEGELLDERSTRDHVAGDAGLDPSDLQAWIDDPETQKVLEEDLKMARQPMPEGLAQDDRLADWEDGRRYTCPSYEVTREEDGVTASVPGFQPLAAYTVVLANLIPEADQRETPGDVAEVLEWADFPLASQEVAEICEIEPAEARQRLGMVAEERHIGADGIWTLR